MRLLILPVLAFGLTACDILGVGDACTTEARPGIWLAVTDSISGDTLVAGDVQVHIRDGSYQDVVSEPSAQVPAVFYLATERPGNYDLTVSSDGYTDWTADDVEVVAGECHVETVDLTARMQPGA